MSKQSLADVMGPIEKPAEQPTRLFPIIDGFYLTFEPATIPAELMQFAVAFQDVFNELCTF